MTQDETHLPVASAYDRWAPAYDRYPNPMLAAAGRILAELAPSARGLRVLEFGCGTGRNLAVLAAAGAARLTGLDLSPGMLAEARTRLPEAALFEHDMTLPVPLPDATADLILFVLALEHVGELAPPLAEAARLLAAGGTVLVAEIHPALAAGGVGAHFVDGGEVVRMPTFAHRVEDYLDACSASGLAVAAGREWRARDVAPEGDPGDVPKVWKRGPDALLAIEFRLRHASELTPA